ncbi:MAG: DUF6263 family protein [Candidatus Omnitrophota bacterium]
MKHLQRIFVFIGIVVLFCHAWAFAQEGPVQLEYRYTPGQPLHYRYAFSIKGKQSFPEGNDPAIAAAGEQTFASEMSSRVTMEPKTVESDGSGWVDIRYDALEVKQKWNEEEWQDGTEALKALVGQAVSLHLQKDGKLLEAAMPSGEAAGSELVNQFQQMYGQAEGIFPDKPVQVGESWAKQLQLPMAGMAQPAQVNFQNTLESFEMVNHRKCAKIKSVLTFDIPETKVTQEEAGDNIGLSMNVKGEGAMTQYFDISGGVLVKGEGKTTMNSKQTMTVPVGPAGTPQTVVSLSVMEMDFKTELE